MSHVLLIYGISAHASNVKRGLEYLQPKKNGFYIDGTLGGGGYTEAIAKSPGRTEKF